MSQLYVAAAARCTPPAGGRARAAGRYAAPPMFARPVIFYLMEILTTKPVRGPAIYYLFEILRPVRDRASSVTTVEYEYTRY
jgi:hypothetical protein